MYNKTARYGKKFTSRSMWCYGEEKERAPVSRSMWHYGEKKEHAEMRENRVRLRNEEKRRKGVLPQDSLWRATELGVELGIPKVGKA